ncbi:titin homolog [Monomorium pharaonis]|uniref:titin homolog n=1 Tax=Monomorium pharaonis TaxID=307658 RepID=UPI00063F308E|nr:titin homolog [Monomorium pharaonis]XP_036138778.1 titin homolog [Monomorium pharaonis]XP_036138779.1 titin homolog [Monomorium pharaonis]
MATPSKRITRLRTREPSVKATLEKKPKPGKVITTRKNSKRINVSAKDKAVTTNKNSKMVSVTAKGKTVATNKDSKKVSATTRDKAVTTSKNLKKINVTTRDKAVAANKDSKKVSVTAKDKAVTTSKDLKKVNIIAKNKAVTTSKASMKVNVSTKGKHLGVSEKNTFLRKNKVSPRYLRPRQNKKNYCEDSRLMEQFILPKQQDSTVVLEKLNVKDKHEKVPVYKAMKSDKSSEDKIDVYDFKFDANDAMEKVKKKQRKRNINREKGKISKKTKKKVTAQPKRIEIIESPEPNANVSVEFTQCDLPLESAVVVVESTKEKEIKKLEIIADVAKRTETSEMNADIQTAKESMSKDIEKDVEQGIDANVQIAENSMEDTARNIETQRADTNIHDETTLPRGTLARQIRKNNPSKPRIISVENANNIIVTKSPLNTEDSRPFRPKNIFDNKTSLTESNLTLRNSLIFTKTLSPILKTTSTYDFGSPCRPPMLMFSKTKHFIQSTPYKDVETNKEIKKINKNSVETNKENVKINKENMEIDKENMEMVKENMDTNKENKGWRDKERKNKAVSLRKKLVQKKLPILENKAPEKVPHKSGPVRVSLGEIKNLLRSNNNEDNKQTEADQTYTDVSKSFVEQKNKQLADYLNFSDTFDVLSETERLSSVGNDVPLFMDLEPTHFSKPPQYSYKRKRAVKFDFSEDSSDNEEEKDKENIKSRPKKKKHIKSETEQEKRINEWVKTVNSTFQEIEEYDLVIE